MFFFSMSLKIQTIYAQVCTPRVSRSEDPASIRTNTSLPVSLKFKQLPVQPLRLVTFKTYSDHYKGYHSKYLIWYEVFIGLWTIGGRWLFFPGSWSTSMFYKIKGTQLLYHLLVLLLFIFPKMKVVGDCVSGVTFSPSLAWSCHRHFQELGISQFCRNDDLGRGLPVHMRWHQPTIVYWNTVLY